MTSPINHLCTVKQASECITTLLLTVFAQRNFAADSLREKYLLYYKRPLYVFESPLGLEATSYVVHLRLTGKHVVDFIIEL